MKSRRIDGGFLLRLDRGEEVVSALMDLCAKEGIGFASISGIGAAERVTLAVFDTKTKKYLERAFAGDIELVSLTGNAAVADGDPKIHIHACISDHSFSAHGGHLVSAIISVTCELVLLVSEETVTRKKDERTGLMLID